MNSVCDLVRDQAWLQARGQVRDRVCAVVWSQVPGIHTNTIEVIQAGVND